MSLGISVQAVMAGPNQGWCRVTPSMPDRVLMRPGRVVVHLVFGQDGTQVCLVDNQHAVQELAAQGADEPFADRVHPRSLDGGARDRGAGGFEDGVERGGEVGTAVADQESDVLEPRVEVHGQVAGSSGEGCPGLWARHDLEICHVDWAAALAYGVHDQVNRASH